MARKGPVIVNEHSIPLGLAQVRVGAFAEHIANIHPALTSSDSVGALANTSFVGEKEYFTLETGFPLIEDKSWCIREKARLDCAFYELTPANMALATGHDPKSAPYSEMSASSGEIPLGEMGDADFVRMEAVYTYPNGTNTMTIIFPKAQVLGAVNVEFAAENPASVPVSIQARPADSDAPSGEAVWDDKPMGRITWA